MKNLIVLLLLFWLVSFTLGCAQSTMTSERTMSDGSVVKYRVTINSLGQDFAGSDLSATLDPEGKTTVKAGAVDNTMSPVTADVAMAMVEMLRLMLPYMAVPAVP